MDEPKSIRTNQSEGDDVYAVSLARYISAVDFGLSADLITARPLPDKAAKINSAVQITGRTLTAATCTVVFDQPEGDPNERTPEGTLTRRVSLHMILSGDSAEEIMAIAMAVRRWQHWFESSLGARFNTGNP